jgi:hypothetical protein
MFRRDALKILDLPISSKYLIIIVEIFIRGIKFLLVERQIGLVFEEIV